MPELPFLLLPKPIETKRARAPGGSDPDREPLRTPSAQSQAKRLDGKFKAITTSLRALQPTVEGMEPEQVLVFETLGTSVEGVAKAAIKIPGLEWLAELDLDDLAPVAGFVDPNDPSQDLKHRLYALMSNQQAMDDLLRFWQEWKKNPNVDARKKPWHGFGPFKNLFMHLLDLRRWNTTDRIEASGFRQALEEDIDNDERDLTFEVELWYRSGASRRSLGSQEVRNLASDAGGTVLSEYILGEIHYHGLLVHMPKDSAKRFRDAVRNNPATKILACEAVMYFRLHGQARLHDQIPSSIPYHLDQELVSRPPPSGSPVIAVLDGVPLGEHLAIRGRFQLDDPDDHTSAYAKPEQRRHGTAMASAVIHGDLSTGGEPLFRPIHMQPILIPAPSFDASHADEVSPSNRLLVDLIHTAVKRMVDVSNGQATAPSIRIVNLSFGNPYQPFDREMTPLAKLIDWLSWKYRLLFILSMGNHDDPIRLELTSEAWNLLDDHQAVGQTTKSIWKHQQNRRPLSPAEALNAIAVGSLHADGASVVTMGRRIDLLRNESLASPLNPVASGLRRGVKPDVLFPGGRQLYVPSIQSKPGNLVFEPDNSIQPPGIQVAAPGIRAMELDRTSYSRGTSNAAALASHVAGLIHQRIEILRDGSKEAPWDELDEASLIKCLLVHGADWGTAAERIRDALSLTKGGWQTNNRQIARFLGFGAVDTERCLFCTSDRVTLIGWSRIGVDQGHEYRVPLPQTLGSTKVRRRLFATLAWLSPINFKHQKYRCSKLWLTRNSEDKSAGNLFFGPNDNADSNLAQRGTVEHHVWSSEKASPIDENDVLRFSVNCAEDAGKLDKPIPYAIAITIETAEPIRVYESLAERLRALVPVMSKR